MSARLMPSVVAAVAAAVFPLAPAASAANRPCAARSGERVIASSPEALVFQGRRVVACLRNGRRRFRLDTPASPDDGPAEVDNITLSGNFLLYSVRFSVGGGGDEFADLILTDLRTGGSPAIVGFGNRLDRRTEVRASVLKRNGSFAWIQNAYLQYGIVERTVQICPLRTCARGPRRSAAPTVVANSKTISPVSLTLRGSRIFWIEGGKRRSSRL
jgi:hypothetical protein